MKPVRLNSECITCLIKKYLPMYPADAKEPEKVEYMQRLLEIISKAPKSASAPEIVDEIQNVQREMFDNVENFSKTKEYFNNLMMGLAKDLEPKLREAEDSFCLAVCYAMVGNYIDFGAMADVDEEKLKELLEDAESFSVDKEELERLKEELLTAKRLVYLTDNCGEVVLDKLLISEIRKMNPELEIDVILRGEQILNDATLSDAQQIGLGEVARVFGNGSKIAGTCLEKISAEAKSLIENADLIIAKGQGNFETLRFSKLNVYYLFMCKCMMFAERFDVPRFSPMIVNDLRME